MPQRQTGRGGMPLRALASFNKPIARTSFLPRRLVHEFVHSYVSNISAPRYVFVYEIYLNRHHLPENDGGRTFARFEHRLVKNFINFEACFRAVAPTSPPPHSMSRCQKLARALDFKKAPHLFGTSTLSFRLSSWTPVLTRFSLILLLSSTSINRPTDRPCSISLTTFFSWRPRPYWHDAKVPAHDHVPVVTSITTDSIAEDTGECSISFWGVVQNLNFPPFFRYECKDGQVVPKGCLSDSGHRVEVQDTFDTSEHRMQCVLGSDGYLTILYKSCVANGREREVNDRWDDGQTWYSCQKDGNAVRSVPIGCIHEGRQLAFDDRVAKGDAVYSCKKSVSGKPEMGVTGCAKNGNKFTVGEAAESGKLWYTCTDSGWKPTGCVHGNARLKDGDQFHEGDVLYQCTVNGDKTGPVAAGCLMRENGFEVEKKFDCFWTEGDAPYQYEYTCKYDSSRNLALKVQTRCSFKSSQGIFRVEPGCYVTGNGVAVGCIKDYSTGKLETKMFMSGNVDSSMGLRQC